MKIACLGPRGSYSYEVAKKYAQEGEIVCAPSFLGVVNLLVSGEVENAVLPIENTIQGGVLASLDAVSFTNVFAVEQVLLPIDHRIARLEGVDLEDVTTVYSHEQAIGQCSEYLERNFGGCKIVFTTSTVESLNKLDVHSVGIVGAHATKEGVVLSEENIANEKNNRTRFLRFIRGEELPVKSERIFFCARLGHVPGALVNFLQIFSEKGFNLTKIESRPVRDKMGEYRFYIELEGDYTDPVMRETLEIARAMTTEFRLIGAYNAVKTA